MSPVINTHIYNGGSVEDFFCAPSARFTRRESKKSSTERPLYMCVWLINGFLFCNIELFFILKKCAGLIESKSVRRENPVRGKRERGTPTLYHLKGETTEIYIPEIDLEFMKNMDPKQLADLLLPNGDGESDWYIKTSAANASGNWIFYTRTRIQVCVYRCRGKASRAAKVNWRNKCNDIWGSN